MYNDYSFPSMEPEATLINGTLLVFTIILLAVLILIKCIKIVPQAHCQVVERLGKFKTVWKAGIHFKVPVIDRVVKKVSLKEQVYDFPPQPVITKDNVTMQIDSVVYATIFDPQLYTYGIENPISGLQNLAATTLRSIIGEMELDATLSSREEINSKMQAVLDEATDPWGLRVTRVEIKNIQPPREIEEVMTKQMRAERERRQTVLEAQAHQEAVVSRAKGDKEAKVLAAEAEREAKIALAEGRARAVELVYEAEAKGIQNLRNAGIDESILRWNSIKALKDVANGRATKIFMPSDLSSLVSTLGVVGESLGIGNAMKVDTSPAPVEPAPVDACCEDKETSPVTDELKNSSIATNIWDDTVDTAELD